ncbi:MAG: ferritin [Geobacter sp.]|nr:ferritin [Geobacter sp.]
MALKEVFVNIIECTIKMRREAQANYANLSMATESREMQRLFALLAAAEDEHIDKLLAINEEFVHLEPVESGLQGSVCVYHPSIDFSNPGKDLRNDPDAYAHVLQEEEETIEFFDRLVAQAKNDPMRKVCEIAAAKEREHLQMVENIYSFVEEPRTFLEWGEFSNMRAL